MTELVGRNLTTVTKAFFLEGINRFSRDGYGRATRKSMVIFLLMWLALAVWTLWNGGTLFQTLGYLLLVGLIGVWLCLVLPRSHAKRLWARHEGKYGPNARRQTDFFHDHLCVTGDCMSKTVSYSDIHQILETKHLIILVCADKTALLLDKTGFCVHDWASILQHIQTTMKN